MMSFHPAILLAYGCFGFTVAATLYLFVRSFMDGTWGKHSEDVKYQVFEDSAQEGSHYE